MPAAAEPDEQEKKIQPAAAPTGPHIDQKTTASLTHKELFFGPLPHPEHIRQYEAICPGIAAKIFESKDREQKHRHDMERLQVESLIKDRFAERMERSRGQQFAFIISIVGILSGAVVTGIGHSVAGPFISGGSLATLVGLFIAGKKADLSMQNQEPKEETGGPAPDAHVNSKAQSVEIEQTQSRRSEA